MRQVALGTSSTFDIKSETSTEKAAIMHANPAQSTV
jgi:hypothetical protein